MIVNGKPRFVRDQISKAKLVPKNDTLKEQSHDIKKPSRVPSVVSPSRFIVSGFSTCRIQQTSVFQKLVPEPAFLLISTKKH